MAVAVKSRWRASAPRLSTAGAASDDNRNLIVLVVVAAAIRVFLIASYPAILSADSPSYLAVAHHLAALNLYGQPGSRTPGYPLLLILTGYSPTATWVLQAALGVLATVLVYRLVRRLGGSPTSALVAGLCFTLSFAVLGNERRMLTESVASLLLTVGALCAVRIIQRGEARWRAVLGMGLILGYLCATRPEMLVVTLYLAIWVLIGIAKTQARARPLRARSLSRLALVLLGPAVLALAGWALVNRITVGVTTVSTVMGHNVIDVAAPYVAVEPGADHAITAIFVATRTAMARERITSFNTSWRALVPMMRAEGLGKAPQLVWLRAAAKLSGRLLSIGLHAIVTHPFAYVRDSLRQWPPFWEQMNYGLEFARGAGSSAIHGITDVQRYLQAIFACWFIAICALSAIFAPVRRRLAFNREMALIAGAALVASVPVAFLVRHPERWGLIYDPLWLAVGVVAVGNFAHQISQRRFAHSRH